MPDLEPPGRNTSSLAVLGSNYTHLYHANRFSRSQNTVPPGAAEGLAFLSSEVVWSKVERLRGASSIEHGMPLRMPLSDHKPAAILAERQRLDFMPHRALEPPDLFLFKEQRNIIVLIAGLGNDQLMFGDGIHMFVNSTPTHLVPSLQVYRRQIAAFFRHHSL